MIKMMNMYIIYSWRENLQEAEERMGYVVGWLGVRWGVPLYFLSIVKFSRTGCIRRRGDCPDPSREMKTSIISIMNF